MKNSLELSDFKKIFDNADMGAYIYTKDEGVIYVNKSLLSFLNFKHQDFIGFNFIRYIDETEKAEVIKYANLAFAGEMDDIPYPVEIKIRKGESGGKIRFYPEVMIIGNNKYIVGFAVNITGEEKIKKKDKMLGLNDDMLNLLEKFNNMLTGILGYASLLKLKERRKEDSEIIKKIYDTTIKASKIIGSIVPPQDVLSEEENRFLIADEDSISVAILREILEKQKYSIIVLSGKEIIPETIKYLDTIRGVFVDIYIPGVNTFGYISDILNKKSDLNVVLMAHERELREVQDILDVHDVYFLQKPIVEDNVFNLIKLMERS
ncbi:MAG: response regulator [Proteobacteria bacterium]|nr:response regulator [Pseudomonadota bacterium]